MPMIVTKIDLRDCGGVSQAIYEDYSRLDGISRNISCSVMKYSASFFDINYSGILEIPAICDKKVASCLNFFPSNIKQ